MKRLILTASLMVFTFQFEAGAQPGVSLRPVDVFIVAGQSNATGLATPTELQQSELLGPQIGLLFYANSTLWTPASIADSAVWSAAHPPIWVPMKLPTEPETQPRGIPGQIPGTFGPEFALGRTYLADRRGDSQVAIIKADWPGSNLHFQWNPNAQEGPKYFARMLSNVREGLQALKTAGLNGRVKAFFWMQGEGDVMQTREAYQSDLTEFISSVRNSLLEPEMPFLIGQISDQGGEEGDITNVQSAQALVATIVGHTALIVTNDLPLRQTDPLIDPYPIHFNTAAQLALGERFEWAYEHTLGQSAKSSIVELVNTGMREAVTIKNSDLGSNRRHLGGKDSNWTTSPLTHRHPKVIAAPVLGINDLSKSSKKLTAYPNSQWIGVRGETTQTAVSFTSHFHLPESGFDPVFITGQFAAAKGTRVYLNGHDLNLRSVFGIEDWTPFTLQTDTLPIDVAFVPGDNVLTFVVPANESGLSLRVEFLDAITATTQH